VSPEGGGTWRTEDPGRPHDPDWRHGYLVHFRRLVQAGLPSRDTAITIARGMSFSEAILRMRRSDP
jgi:hypothetical protein